MKCEEFEAIGLGLEREGSVSLNGADATERASAIEHANSCARCAALQESWEQARAELLALRLATQDASTPLRVEMRLRQEFRTKHRVVRARTTAVVTAWVLAGAAMVVGAVSLWNWKIEQRRSVEVAARTASDIDRNATDPDALVADNSAGEFTLLPGSLPQETDGAAIVRVRLQRGTLGAMGLPVNQELAGEWIQVDLLVGEDGQPQAVRLPQ
jgi:hypothetical protein